MKPTSSHAAFEADFKAFLDSELPFWRRIQVRRHLQFCPACREEVRIMQTIETELKSETSAPLPTDLRTKLLESVPIETPKAAPRARRLTPQFVFGAGSIAVLAALMALPPFFGRARENARHLGAGSKMQQSGWEHQKYAQDYDEKLASQIPSAEPAAGAVAGSAYSRSPLSSSTRSADSLEFDDSGVPNQRQVHKQGSISIAVDDAEAKGNSVEILVKNVGGYVAQNALSTGSDGRKSATLDVRVPVAQFETVVAKVGKLGIVREKSVNGEDITRRVTVAGARRQSLSRELSIREAQLRAASPKKAAQKAAIVRDVRQLRVEANQARAQLEYLRKYADLATLFVTLQDKPKPVVAAGTTSGLNQTARVAWSSFLSSAQLPLQLLIWVAAYTPLWLPALLVWRKFGRKWMSAA